MARLLAAASLLLLGVVAAVENSPSSEPAPLFPAVFVFGDSLADNGNNNYLQTLARANMLPNGIDFPSGPTGRFCNGKTIVDVLSDLIGLPYAPPYLAPTTTWPGISTGVNYASAAAGILPSSGKNFIANIPLGKQLGYFNISLTLIRKKLGEDEAVRHISKSLFSVAIGSNDYINNYFINNTLQLLYAPVEFRKLLISSFSDNLQILYSLGARKFIISGLGPLGCIPAVLNKLNSTGSCVQFINDVSVSYNSALKRIITRLNHELEGTHFVYTDAYQGLEHILNNPVSSGFNNTNTGCCGSGKFNGQMPCFPVISTLCKNRTSYVFWDAFHPTEAVNKILGVKFFNGSQAYTHPINIEKLAQV